MTIPRILLKRKGYFDTLTYLEVTALLSEIKGDGL
jgi:hypothetical protein